MVKGDEVKSVLEHLSEPLTGLSFYQAGLIKEIFVKDDTVKVIFQFPSPNYPYREQLKKIAEKEIEKLGLFAKILIEEAEREVHL